MKEAFDPPASVVTTPENATSSCMRSIMRNDVLAGRDTIPPHRSWDSMKCEEDANFLSHANRALSLLDYDAQSSESKYAVAIGSDVYSTEEISPESEYDRQHPYFDLSNSSWENSSSSSEAVARNPDASTHVMEKMRTKSNIFGPGHDYLNSYRTTGPRMRRSYPEAAKVDFSFDCHPEHKYKGSNRFTALPNCNGQSTEHRNEIVELPRGTRYVDETTSLSSRWCFDNGGRGDPSLPRGLMYGDEIPSLSTRRCNGNEALSWHHGSEIPSLSSREGYGDEIPSLSTQKCNGISRSSQWPFGAESPSLSSRQSYGDEIPSLSAQKCNGISYSRQFQYGAESHMFSSRQVYSSEIPALSRRFRYQDTTPLYSGQRCHDAEARRLSSYQQGASHGRGHPSDNYASSLVSNPQIKITTNRHTGTRAWVANRVVNSTNHCRNSKKENPLRNSEDIRDQVCGPRANKLNNATTATTKKDTLSPLVHRDQFNRSDFSVQYEHAKFYMIKSYSEDDIHKGIKYNVWASTPNGNSKLDAAFHEAKNLMKETGSKCPVFLFFSVNTSGQFVGLAEMLGPVDFKKTMEFWQQDKWNGFFPVIWHIVKDIPNRLFKHITLENNDNRPVTFSRDTQEIHLPQGLELLKIFKAYRHVTSILDDFDFYEEKKNSRCAQDGINVDSLHEARLSYFGKDDLKSMGDLEAGMESMNFYESCED
ncbi:uncharacterized protein LOC100846773 isoform X2 [Brachypodium distachyon]|uniref:YTH domain-containing family protein n=1 Tax=Brachypodium distachyon TaxID=15368 RepID=I1IVN9_BRADI|nr:uncharacterized protein LOC100846773 isoform X2 [Brachypodium distachyon]KQJ81537.1 hypothetical protein BRADI_5g01317v3 [Brachypodium distachyon]KQJ81542.1 hypothetical protein BRADI_5g01317v3 [Brachypodium distachyon]|eukprot:XP_010239638.1 uncharacterized protein LOC100846773 isoform X2 [Brachypodium distachyon]